MMGKLPKLNQYVIVHKSGAVTVLLADYLKSPKGRSELQAFKHLREHIRSMDCTTLSK